MADPLEQEASRRRRVVYHGLKEFVPDAAVLQALDLLRQEFPPSAPFSVNVFLKKLSARVDLAAQGNRVFGSLFKKNLLPADQVGPDPQPASGPAAAAAPVAPPTTPPGPPTPSPAAKPVVFHRGRPLE